MSVFLSYSTADRKLAEKLRVELERQGISVWADDEVRSGENWQQRIEQAIRSAEAILILVGSRSSYDEAQQSTWRIALETVWQNRALPLIPLLIGDVGLPPFVFSDSIDTPVIRLHDASDLPSAARTLHSALRKNGQAGSSMGRPVTSDPAMTMGPYPPDPQTEPYPIDPPPTKGSYSAYFDRERKNRRTEIRQFVESLKN